MTSKYEIGARDVCIMDHRWRVISIQQKPMKLNNRINFITEDSTHEFPEASRGPSASKASNNIISFRENGCQSVFSRYCSVLPLHSMYRQPTAAADKMTDMPELHSGQIVWLNPRFLNHFSQDRSIYRVFQLDMLHFKRLLGHQKSTFKS